ncbi:MAG: hypothetical protein Q9227_004152 [Pyrenula ochraceoflavens]
MIQFKLTDNLTDTETMASATLQGQKPATQLPKSKDKSDKSKKGGMVAVQKQPTAPRALPDFIQERNAFFDELIKQRSQEISAKPRRDIKLTVKIADSDDIILDGKTWETTPGHLLRHVPKEISAGIVVAKVNNVLWDLDRPLEEENDTTIHLLSIKDTDGRSVFWHSSAHVLGEAAEHEYGCRLSHGPPTDQGFFYDMALDQESSVQETDWPSLETRVKRFVKDKQSFERLLVSKDDLRKMFGYSRYKMHYIEKFVPDGESSTVYRNGSLVDLCQGPHIQNTRKIDAFKITSTSSAHFLGDQKEDSLSRIYGVAFPSKAELKAWEENMALRNERKHMKIAKDQKLFFFSRLSPGSPFLLPHGTRIFNALQAMIREQYWKRGYDEVQSPNMYDVELWKTSGHWQHYQDDMFRVQVEKGPAPVEANATTIAAEPDGAAPTVNKDQGLFGLKPMNCPGHCLLFRHEDRSYRDLPWRIADFGVLHRNEASGALSGMTRVRKFQQDDTHIFCTLDQVTSEIEGLLDFMTYVYNLFGFSFKLKLSTRPEGYMGTIDQWNDAEERLRKALVQFRGDKWELNEGDGAFYGPKIDVVIADCMDREFQCATIQLDFQGPANFQLEYMTGEAGNLEPKASANETAVDGTQAKSEPSTTALKEPGPGRARPVMLHRAIVGSFERFIAILTEHFAGKWPFWLSPRQILVIPVFKAAHGYAEEVRKMFHDAFFYADVDLSGNTLQKKIALGQAEKYNFTIVVGAKEEETRTLNIRNRDDPSTQKLGSLVPLDEALYKMKLLRDERRIKNEL